MSSVLILATRYDSATFYSYEWAEELHKDLLRAGHKSIFLNPDGLGTGLTAAVARAEYVVFYGHGEKDSWIALPALATRTPGLSANAANLASTATIKVFAGRKLYSGCCYSLSDLGQKFHYNYNGSIVGYTNSFGFEFENHIYFAEVVNASVVKYISGDSSQQVKIQLEKDWDALRQDFMNGKHSTKSNAFAAGQWADKNKKSLDYY